MVITTGVQLILERDQADDALGALGDHFRLNADFDLKDCDFAIDALA
jgi:hypothetical protein